MKNIKILENIIFSTLLGAYVVFMFIIFFNFVEPAFTGVTNERVGADSLTYIQVAKSLEETGDLRLESFIRLGGNFLGPTATLWIFDYNYFYIFLFNLLLFLGFLILVIVKLKVSKIPIMIFIIFNPLVTFSVLTVNKEIFSILGIGFLIYYTKKRSLLSIIVAIFFSIFARWQQLLVCLVVLAYFNFGFLNRIKMTYFTVIILLTASLSLVLFSSNISNLVDENQDYVTSQYSALNSLLPSLNRLQSQGFYFLAFPIKLFFNLIGNLSRIQDTFNLSNDIDFYNRIQIFHQIAMLIVIIIAFYKQIFYKKHFLTLTLLIYCIVFTINPTINYRYYLPVYFLLILSSYSPSREIELSSGLK